MGMTGATMRAFMAGCLGSIVILAGCTQADGTTAIGRVGSPAWMATASTETKVSTYRNNCVAYGFEPGTVEMATCLQKEAERYSQRASERAAANAEKHRRQEVYVNPIRIPVHTSCNTLGTFTTCSSY